MRTTTTYGISYPESSDHTRTWEYWQTLATKVDDLLAGRAGQLTIAGDVRIGDPATTTDNMLKLTKVAGGVALENRHRVFPTGSGGGQGTVVSNEIWENGAEQAQLFYRRDGALFLKTGGAAGTVRPVPFAMATGFVNVTVTGVTVGTATFTWPTGRFNSTDGAPLVFAQSTNNVWFATITVNSNTGCTVSLRSYNGATGSGVIPVYLWAVQMTPTTNQG